MKNDHFTPFSPNFCKDLFKVPKESIEAAENQEGEESIEAAENQEGEESTLSVTFSVDGGPEKHWGFFTGRLPEPQEEPEGGIVVVVDKDGTVQAKAVDGWTFEALLNLIETQVID